jgi:predicted transcriptional regulator of viral defense system
MKAITLLKELEAYPVFTMSELSRIVRKDERYVKLLAHRLQKRGLIQRVEKGKYTVFNEPVEFACYIVSPSYISFWTALLIHNLTEQIPRGVMLAIPGQKKPIFFKGDEISFTTTRHFWGYTRERHWQTQIFLAEKEKAVIDCLLARNTPFEEPAKAIESDELDYEKLMEYTKRTKNKSLAKRIGYLMEHFGKNADPLIGMTDRNYIPLDPDQKKKGKRDRRWKIIVNRRVEHANSH